MASIHASPAPIAGAIWRRLLVEKSTGLARTTLYRRIKRGLFTKPVRLGGERVGWPAEEVVAINKARIAGKDDEAIKQLVTELHAARGGEVAA